MKIRYYYPVININAEILVNIFIINIYKFYNILNIIILNKDI